MVDTGHQPFGRLHRSSNPLKAPISLKPAVDDLSMVTNHTMVTNAAHGISGRLRRRQVRLIHVHANQTAFNYDAFWEQLWDRANRVHVNLAAQSVRRRAMRPRVYVYDLPKPFGDFNVTATSAFGTAFGSLLKQVGGAQLRDTSGYAFAALLHYRLWNSRMYRTDDPSQADLFFVPILTAPKRTFAFRTACEEVGAKLHRLTPLLPHLNEHTARRHFVVLSKEHSWGDDRVSTGIHSKGSKCTGWFQKPTGPWASMIRIAYSHKQPAALVRASQYWTDRVFTREFVDADGHFPNLYSVPFPGSVHAIPTASARHVERSPASVQPWDKNRRRRYAASSMGRGNHSGVAVREKPAASARHVKRAPTSVLPWDTSRRRRYAASYVGTWNHGDMAVRKKLWGQCKRMGRRCITMGFAHGSAMTIKGNSDFCLEAGGDTPMRKSLADSIGMGCIPMIFHPITVNANDWLWANWKDAALVNVPRNEFLAGRLNLSRLVETAPPQLVALMKSTLTANAQQFQISLDDDDLDAIHMILTGMQRVLQADGSMALAQAEHGTGRAQVAHTDR